MIQKGTYLNVVDNCGAKKVCCIHVYGGYRKRYGHVGDIILLAIKSLRKKRSDKLKIKKGDITKGIIVKTKRPSIKYSRDGTLFFENSVVLINNQNKFLGSRIFTSLEKKFLETRYLKMLSICSGVIQ